MIYLNKMIKINLDEWQKEILKTKGNLVLRSGRQVGKSTIVARKAGDYAVKNRNSNIMVISAVERQSYLLFEKILQYLEQYYKNYIKKGKDKPTKHKLSLTNGSVIYSLPTGLSGMGIRGYTINLLIADEAAFIPEDVWTAVTPMITMTGGYIWLLSTPHGKRGYYYNCFFDDSFTSFHISTEDVLNFENRTEKQKEDLKKHLDLEQKRMTKLQYAQEYLGEFIDELKQVFSDEIIKKCCILKRPSNIEKGDRIYYLGADIAGLGGDEITLEIIKKLDNENFIQIENIIRKKQLTTETSKDIITLNKKYEFYKIGVDDGGVGFGVFSQLLDEDETKRKTYALNNASRPLNKDGTKNKKLLKEEMYMNLLALMESGKIKLLDDDEIAQSLKSIQYEYIDKDKTKGEKEETRGTKLKITGSYSHITEGIIRACWLASQDKHLNIFVRTF